MKVEIRKRGNVIESAFFVNAEIPSMVINTCKKWREPDYSICGCGVMEYVFTKHNRVSFIAETEEEDNLFLETITALIHCKDQLQYIFLYPSKLIEEEGK